MDGDTDLEALAEREGWQREDETARVHYRGETEQYSIEFYAAVEVVLYWRVLEAGERAVPVDRGSVPPPLRERIRNDLAEAGIDPDVEGIQV